MWASLCAIGAAMGRNYRTESNLRSNLYVVGIADGGSGKNHAREIGKELIAFASPDLMHSTSQPADAALASCDQRIGGVWRQVASLWISLSFPKEIRSLAGRRGQSAPGSQSPCLRKNVSPWLPDMGAERPIWGEAAFGGNATGHPAISGNLLACAQPRLAQTHHADSSYRSVVARTA